MIWRSATRPTLGWAHAIIAVCGGILIPALPAFAALWIGQIDIRDLITQAGPVARGIWLAAAGLAAAPLFLWIAVPVAAPLLRVAARRGWAGPGSVTVMAIAVGLPIIHVVFNGDLTGEAPEMIPIVVALLAVHAICGWVILRVGAKAAGANAHTAQS